MMPTTQWGRKETIIFPPHSPICSRSGSHRTSADNHHDSGAILVRMAVTECAEQGTARAHSFGQGTAVLRSSDRRVRISNRFHEPLIGSPIIEFSCLIKVARMGLIAPGYFA